MRRGRFGGRTWGDGMAAGSAWVLGWWAISTGVVWAGVVLIVCAVGLALIAWRWS